MRVIGLSLGLARAYLLISSQGLVLVDAGSPGVAGRVIRLMRSLGRDDLRLIYITHAHLDHYGSAAALRRLTGAQIAIHHADGQAMSTGATELGVARGRGRIVQWTFPVLEALLKPEPALPDRLVEDGDSLEDFGLEAVVVHTPGHTSGSSCLLVEGRIAFAGDLLSTNGGVHAQRYYAEDWSLIPSSLHRLQTFEPEWVYPGHGPVPINGQELASLVREQLISVR